MLAGTQNASPPLIDSECRKTHILFLAKYLPHEKQPLPNSNLVACQKI